MERVPNIDWKTLEEAIIHFIKVPNLIRVSSIIVPMGLPSYAKEYYGNTAEVVAADCIYEDPKTFMLEEKKVPFWQQINRRKKR